MTARTKASKASTAVPAHKLFAPTDYEGAIRREAVVRQAVDGDSPIVLLQGPAGHGKSTILQQIKSSCEAQDYKTAWLTLDETDNDPRRFYLSVQTMLSGLGSADHADGGRHKSDWMIGRILGSKSPVALFFDEFQVLSNATVLNFFLEVFEHLPPPHRLFVGTRSVPEMGLSRLLVNQRAQLLQADYLRFTRTEVEQFFLQSGSDLNAEEISAIYRRTEGWPAALQLFRLSLSSQRVRESLTGLAEHTPRELAEYLADNVLSLQPATIRDFLFRTSLLDRMTASLCEAVTAKTDAQDLLLQLERGGLFVRGLDSDGKWFKYHSLFASFLAEDLQARAPETVLAVHRKAAHWHLEHGLHEGAVRHAIACRDYALAADTLDEWASQLVADAQLVTLERWFDRLPFETIMQRPMLLIKSAWALVFLHRQQKLAPLLRLLEQRAAAGATDGNIVLAMAAISADDREGAARWVQSVNLREEITEAFAAHQLGAAANLAAYLKQINGDFEEARALLALARAHNQRGGVSFSRGYTVGVQGVNHLLQGRLREALQGMQDGLDKSRLHSSKSVAPAALAAPYIWALYEANELDQAEALFGQHHEAIGESALLDFVAVTYLSMARIHDTRGRPERALERLDEAEAIGHAHGWQRLVSIINWERVRRALMAGNLERAVSIAALDPVAPTTAGLPFANDAEGAILGTIRLAIHRMELKRASDMLAREFVCQRDRIYRLIKLNLLDAQLHQRRGESNGAQRCLHKALQLAAPGGFIRCFLDEGDAVLQLLREGYQHLLESDAVEVVPGVSRAYLEALLQASGMDLSHSVEMRHPPLVESLTDREKEILVFLANGTSNKEMAGRLFVSENTIKFHLKNIYAKLMVRSRLQAITTSRELGLIH